MNQKKVERKYLPEFVYGGMDGTITTFAVIAGVIGASLSSVIVLILGFANLFADGFSMSVANYLSTKSRNEVSKNGKVNAYKTAFATFGAFIFMGFIPLLSFVVASATGNPHLIASQFKYSIILTTIALFTIGWMKGVVTEKHRLGSGIQTLIIGGIASGLAFIVGEFLSRIV